MRVGASLSSGSYGVLLDVAGALWGVALLLFLLVYAPILWRPRLGEQA
jgi:uncharacterized protein involved in response to NO